VGDAEDDKEGEEDIHAPAADRDGRLWSAAKHRGKLGYRVGDSPEGCEVMDKKEFQSGLTSEVLNMGKTNHGAKYFVAAKHATSTTTITDSTISTQSIMLPLPDL
jgi:hypothetical protein